MQDINSISQSDFHTGLGTRTKTEAETSDKDTFLKLMIAQLENQNPLDPQKAGSFWLS